MSELTTERLEKKIKSCIEIENCEVMMPLSAAQELLESRRILEGLDQPAIDGGWTARGISEYAKELEAKLLAYEQAAKNEVALPEALKYAEIYGRAFICVDRSGSVHAVDPSQITLTILNEPAPVLPKQPEPESIICWSCKKTITLTQRAEADGFCPLCDAEIELEPAQPVIPEQPHRISDDDLVAVPRSILACAGFALRNPQLKDGNVYAELRTYRFAPAITAQPVSEPYSLPSGWMLVPEEATIAMLTLLGLTGSFDFMQQCYKNMLAATPAQESE
ncbi:hypothetical protein [Obesumbacterium proteus]|uniref:hypothetical protein n=1 Tax=Obesumbacterium proteus TaxID=82983 RepID=UPI002432E95D|nr:hypothetical protein [Obesumbacterium proteus]